MSESPTPAPAPTGLQKYLDRALQVLDRFPSLSGKEAPSEMVSLLERVAHVDEAKVLAIGRTVQHMGRFNELVRDRVENISIGDRYRDITELFDSVRDDSKTLIAQLSDGKIDLGEKLQNLWMRLRRGTPSDRFEKIVERYQDVCEDTKDQLEREKAILGGYIDFRFALKESEILSRELLRVQEQRLETARAALAEAQAAVDSAKDAAGSDHSRLQLQRDEATHRFQEEDRNYQLLKDVTENLSIGYDVGETLIAKLKQTHDVKDQVYRRAVTFFTTNEHVFTVLGAVYTSQHGLHEATQATEAMKEGVNKGLEDVAELGRELERAALEAGYGSTIRAESVQKLVDAITSFQSESLELIDQLRKESTENAAEIRRVVEAGKEKVQQTLEKHARGA